MQGLRFETFTLDGLSGLLMRNGSRVPLRRQASKVLTYLAEHPGQLVTNKELIESCWGNPRQTSVNSLAQCIKAVREALGEGDHEIIRTVHGQGYVFTASVSMVPTEHVAPSATAERQVASTQNVREFSDSSVAPQESDQGLARAVPEDRVAPPIPRTPAPHLLRPRNIAPAAGILILLVLGVLVGGTGPIVSWLSGRAEITMMGVPSIAVLPFETADDESQKSDAVVTLADDVTTELARTPRGYDLRIRSASGYTPRALSPGRAGRELDVRYLVLGTMRREGEARRVNIQLVEAEGSRPVWAELFTYAPGDSEGQTRLAERIARAIGAQVLRAESRLPLPASPEAGNFVILGRSLMSGQGGEQANRKAMAFFDKARALNPDSVPALLGYGRTRVNAVLNGWVPAREANALLDESGPAIRHANEIDSRDVGLQVLRGAYLRARGRDEDAIAAFERALDLLPSYALAHAELGRTKIEVGLADQTVAEVKEAVRLSPDDPYIGAWYLWAGMADAHVGHYEQAVNWLLKAGNENRVHVNTALWLAIAYGGLAQWDEARRYFQEHLKNAPRFSISGWSQAMPSRNSTTVATQRARIVTILCRLGTSGCDDQHPTVAAESTDGR